VVVPATSDMAEPTGLEGREVERSLAALKVTAGGTFAEEAFEIPPDEGSVADDPRAASPAAGVTLPRWSIYALLLAFPAVAAAAFLCGCLWMAAGRR
jgi:hypothetical protein